MKEDFEPLSYKQFRRLCKRSRSRSRGAIVRWVSSGIVEQLDWETDESGAGYPVAINPLTGKRHKIFVYKKDKSLRDEWWCEEVDPDLPVSLGKLDKALKEKVFRL